jgi:hypothetical protein
MEPIMSMFAEFLPLLDPKFLMQIFRLVCRQFGSTALGRRIDGLIVLSLRLGMLIMRMLRSIVTETTGPIGHGSSQALAPRLGLISIVCTVLYAVPPTSIPGAILVAGCLGAAQMCYARSGGMLPVCMLFGCCAALLLWAGPWWHARDLRLLPSRRRHCCVGN